MTYLGEPQPACEGRDGDEPTPHAHEGAQRSSAGPDAQSLQRSCFNPRRLTYHQKITKHTLKKGLGCGWFPYVSRDCAEHFFNGGVRTRIESTSRPTIFPERDCATHAAEKKKRLRCSYTKRPERDSSWITSGLRRHKVTRTEKYSDGHRSFLDTARELYPPVQANTTARAG